MKEKLLRFQVNTVRNTIKSAMKDKVERVYTILGNESFRPFIIFMMLKSNERAFQRFRKIIP